KRRATASVADPVTPSPRGASLQRAGATTVDPRPEEERMDVDAKPDARQGAGRGRRRAEVTEMALTTPPTGGTPTKARSAGRAAQTKQAGPAALDVLLTDAAVRRGTEGAFDKPGPAANVLAGQALHPAPPAYQCSNSIGL